MNDLVYVVDDEKTITDIVKFNLVQEGFEVKTFPDGKDCLLYTSDAADDCCRV